MVTWSTAKASFLPLCNCKADAPGPHTLIAWFICSVRMGVSAQGLGRGGGKGEESKQNI